MAKELRSPGIAETALYVSDLERSTEFYERLFGFREVLREDGRLHALKVNDSQVLLLFRAGGTNQYVELPGGRIPPHDGHGQMHVAFAIHREDIEPWRERLRELNISISSEVSFPSGGQSIYFRDPDDHLIELATPGIWKMN